MSDELIQWPGAKYWTKCFNPIIGCRKLSPACENCYAEAFVKRFNMTGCECNGFEPTRKENGKKMPQRGVVFCGNITDLFGSWVTPEEQDKWFEDMNQSVTKDGRHEAAYLWLTKRPGNMAHAIHDSYEWLGDNAYFGFTAENQEWYNKRISEWRFGKPTWANGWLSAEPLLSSIDLGLNYIAPEDMPFKWIVVGCESGPQRRPCKIEWVEGIVDQALSRGIPVFVKQLDIDGKCVRDIEKFPQHLQIRQVPWKGRYQ